MKRTLGIFLVIFGLVSIAIAISTLNSNGSIASSSASQSGSSGGSSSSPEIGKIAPDFELTSVSGQSVKLSDYRGKVVLVNFWAVWCPPCRQELPDIQQAQDDYADKLAVVTVNAGDATADVIEYLASNGLTFETLLDSNYIVNDQYRVTGLPTSFFIDENGVLQYVQVGILSQAALMDYLSAMGVTN